MSYNYLGYVKYYERNVFEINLDDAYKCIKFISAFNGLNKEYPLIIQAEKTRYPTVAVVTFTSDFPREMAENAINNLLRSL